MSVRAHFDQPEPGSRNDPLNLKINGWLYGEERDRELDAIEIEIEGQVVGATRLRLHRPDVARALQLPADALTGFSVLACAPAFFGRRTVRLDCHARFRDGSRVLAATRQIELIEHDHRQNHYGVLAEPGESRLFHRNDIYASGPSVSIANPDCLELVQRYLGPPPRSVLDVGCGFGAYGRPLLAAGYNWLGIEVKGSDCAELARLGLPHRQVDGRTLPFGAASFDATISIEVLEHIPDPGAFLAEIRRVTRTRALFSVPNLELIPYLHRYAVVPWHLLEADHKNFFTRASLRRVLGEFFANVEVLTYGPLPLNSPEGLPLHNHLFAICDV